MISVNIASHKAREKNLELCLISLCKQNTQPDIINVYLNDYKIQPWMDVMAGEHPINFIEGGEDLGAAAKFWFSDSQEDGVYLTFDDDLVAKPEYVGYLADAAYRYPDSIVGFHGTLYLRWPVQSYYLGPSREIFYCYNGLSRDRGVHMLGTGAMGFRAGLANKPVLSDFKGRNMTDPQIYRKSQEKRIPLMCLHRAPHLIMEQVGSQDSAIWKGLLRDDSVQTEIINSMKPHIFNGVRLDAEKYGDAAIEWGHMKRIMGMIKPDMKVVEFGSGISTKALAACAGDLISFEHNKDWADGDSRLREINSFTGWYDIQEDDVKTIEEADLIVVDGPIGSEGGRYALPVEILPKTATIVVDDCHREKDLNLADKIGEHMGEKPVYIKGKVKKIAIIN